MLFFPIAIVAPVVALVTEQDVSERRARSIIWLTRTTTKAIKLAVISVIPTKSPFIRGALDFGAFPIATVTEHGPWMILRPA